MICRWCGTTAVRSPGHRGQDLTDQIQRAAYEHVPILTGQVLGSLERIARRQDSLRVVTESRRELLSWYHMSAGARRLCENRTIWPEGAQCSVSEIRWSYWRHCEHRHKSLPSDQAPQRNS